MSILVDSVEKVFGAQKALKGVSLRLERGEVVGLLGPNGAGKSTLMRLVTGFLPPTSGRLEVCGFDVMDEPLEAKRRVGYLPEHNPIHEDMYVREYLRFVAGVHAVKHRNERVDAVIEEVGLTPEVHKKIGQLSKGYRQRVGLAQALVHDPEVLILDEPTSGLDPIQLVDIRALIRRLGKTEPSFCPPTSCRKWRPCATAWCSSGSEKLSQMRPWVNSWLQREVSRPNSKPSPREHGSGSSHNWIVV